MERRWRNRSGDHLSSEAGSRDQALERLRGALLPPAEAQRIEAHGAEDAAVLLALFDFPDNPGLIFTERPADMRRHAGEISFPGGRPDPDEDLTETALREAEEEIGLDPSSVEIIGALAPVSTFVTGYRVHPVVGLIPADAPMMPNPAEVAQIFHFRLEHLLEGYKMKRLVRRGVPFRTPTYTVSDQMIWGATARILQNFFENFD